MPRIEIPDGDAPESLRLMGLQPDMAGAMGGFASAIYDKSTLDKRVREAIRMRVAQLNQCVICLNTRFPEFEELGINEDFYKAVENWKDSALLDEKEKLVIEYTELFAQNHLSLDQTFFDKLKEYFSPAEIFEVTVVVAGLLANGRILQVLQVEQQCSI